MTMAENGASGGAGAPDDAEAELARPGDGNPLLLLERDVRLLMRQLGETRFSLQDAERRHRDNMRGLLMPLLEVADALDRVLDHVDTRPDEITPQMRIWLNNFRTGRTLLDRVLCDEGLERVVPKAGEDFDPHKHSVSATAARPDQPEGTIAEVAAPGWLWRGALLRKCAVVVVQGSEATETTDPVIHEGTEPAVQ